ncbi:AbrB/MazE/SpoVT family DNA-binding domain-containing protein [Candidatus Woesearchaeota archaeon]|nr:AbrB/MazE/SpoVT family DNA-binding domain-containing protein [Candidatus Woesearchaeota archaeon]
MAEALVKVKEWGNSLGVILPRQFVKEAGLETGDEIIVMKKRADLKPLFGILKEVNKTTQELKDEMRKSWEHA